MDALDTTAFTLRWVASQLRQEKIGSSDFRAMGLEAMADVAERGDLGAVLEIDEALG